MIINKKAKHIKVIKAAKKKTSNKISQVVVINFLGDLLKFKVSKNLSQT